LRLFIVKDEMGPRSVVQRKDLPGDNPVVG